MSTRLHIQPKGTNLKTQLRKRLLPLLNYTLNPLTRRLAHSRFGPFAVIQHIGRRSGRMYETPIIARKVDDGFIIELTYGEDVDWYKNVVEAGECIVVQQGKEYPVRGLAPLVPEIGRAAFSPIQQAILRALNRQHFVKLLNANWTESEHHKIG